MTTDACITGDSHPATLPDDLILVGDVYPVVSFVMGWYWRVTSLSAHTGETGGGGNASSCGCGGSEIRPGTVWIEQTHICGGNEQCPELRSTVRILPS